MSAAVWVLCIAWNPGSNLNYACYDRHMTSQQCQRAGRSNEKSVVYPIAWECRKT